MNRTLYHCPPLAARISAHTCDANRAHAKKLAQREVEPADRSESAYALLESQRLRMCACLSCPGVRALARRGARAPQVVALQAL